jgi:hypothetical protein
MLDQSINRSQNHGGDQIYTVEVLDSEHFYSPRDKNEYYSSFPEPWNKQPRNDIKAEIEIKSLDSIKNTFFKGRQDGSYFVWRPQAIQVIHKAKLPIDKRILQHKKILGTKDSMDLATIADSDSFGPESYYNLIYQLEIQFGGKARALLFVKLKLIQGDKLRIQDLSSIYTVKTRLINFINHCREHHLMDQVHNSVMQDRVFKALLTDHNLEQLLKDHHTVHFNHSLDSMEIIVDWLDYRATMLSYIEQRLEKGHTFKPITGKSKLSSNPLKPNGGFSGGQDSKSHQTRSGCTYVVQREYNEYVEPQSFDYESSGEAIEEQSEEVLTFQNTTCDHYVDQGQTACNTQEL